MARDACGRGEIEVPVRVALVALQVCVPARQRKSDRVVIETGRLPRRRGVALLARLREAKRDVIRIGCLLKI